jgi:hypothetical protein
MKYILLLVLLMFLSGCFCPDQKSIVVYQDYMVVTGKQQLNSNTCEYFVTTYQPKQGTFDGITYFSVESKFSFVGHSRFQFDVGDTIKFVRADHE